MTPTTTPAWVQEIERNAVLWRPAITADMRHLLSALSEGMETLRGIQLAHQEIPERYVDAGFCDNCGFPHPCSTRQIVDALLARYESGEIGR